MARRLKAMGQSNYAQGFKIAMHEHILNYPLLWKKPLTIFVNSMSDLFHEQVTTDFLLRIFRVMTQTQRHHYQVLTKRSERLLELNSRLPWVSNIWMGVSVENQDYTFRIDHLRQTSAHIKFLSLEPLLGPIHDLDLEGIDWVIVGGESGPKARPMETSWVIDIRDQCRKAGVPFFFKQWGGSKQEKDRPHARRQDLERNASGRLAQICF